MCFGGPPGAVLGGSSKLFGDGARGGEWMGGDPGALWVRGLHGGLFIGVFWFLSATALSRGGREGGLPDLRQFKVSYRKHSQMKDKPLP